MLTGQARFGKTSLKKSLLGEKFDHGEQSTDLIEKSPSYFSVTNEIWRIGEKKQETDPDFLTLPNRIAHAMITDLGDENVANNEVLNMQDQSGNTTLGKSSDTPESADEEPGSDQGRETSRLGEKNQHASGTGNTDSPKKAELEEQESEQEQEAELEEQEFHLYANAAAENAAEFSKQTQEQPEKHNNDENQIKKNAAEQKVQEKTAQCYEKICQEPDRQNKENVFSVIWDFGGQLVYYVTHPLFLTANAIYLLVYDLRQELDDIAPIVTKEGPDGEREDCDCKKTNRDYLHLWLSSISTLASQQSKNQLKRCQSEKLPAKLPPVLLVCTYADKCRDAEDRAKKIHYSLNSQQKYNQHLFYKPFTVNNTLSGTEDECPGVKLLIKEVVAVAKDLLQMQKKIPIKLLKFEDTLKSRNEPCIHWHEAKRIAREECAIADDEQFRAFLNFLHDQRILIHFEGSSELVILNPQWLINLFKSIIAFNTSGDRRHHEKIGSWEKLAVKGILDKELLRDVWAPLLEEATKENTDKQAIEDTIEDLIAVMEKFSLVCEWPSPSGKSNQYFIPSILNSCSEVDVTKLFDESVFKCTAPLFLRFRQPDLLPSGSNKQSDDEYVQVPMGFFPRLFLKFIQWCLSKQFKCFEDRYANLARFPMDSKGIYYVILLCHSSSVEIVVHKAKGKGSHSSDKDTCRNVKRQLESIFEELRQEFFWLNPVESAFSVLCPCCCKKDRHQYVALHCRNKKHRTKGELCKREECLHFWPLTELQMSQKCECKKNTFCTEPFFAVNDYELWMQVNIGHGKGEGLTLRVLLFI